MNEKLLITILEFLIQYKILPNAKNIVFLGLWATYAMHAYNPQCNLQNKLLTILGNNNFYRITGVLKITRHFQ